MADKSGQNSGAAPVVDKQVDEHGAVTVTGHILIRDRDTGEVILDMRDGQTPPAPLPGDEGKEGDAA